MADGGRGDHHRSGNGGREERVSGDRAAFASFGQYMASKEAKLRRQFAEAAGSDCDIGRDGQAAATATATANTTAATALRGVCIWVDGRTQPSREELRALVGRAGGRFETYFHRALVTHVVGTHFPPNKAAELRKMVATSGSGSSRGKGSAGRQLPVLHVVTPQWVVDSVREQRRMPEWRYGVSDVCASGGGGGGGGGGAHSLHAYMRERAKCESRGRSDDDEEGEDEGEEAEEDEEEAMAAIAQEESDDDHSATSMGAPDAAYATLRSTREDPDFVRKYFSQSRLHFIGSFRNAYESIVARLQRERRASASSSPPLPPPPSSPQQKPFVLHVDMDAFFVSVAVALRPELRGRPVAVCHSGRNERGRAQISSASYEAREHGVRAGMLFGEARRLCPQLVTAPYDFDAYRRTCETVYRLFFEHADIVEGVSIDEAYLLIHARNEDEAKARAARLRAEIRERTGGCTASAGIGVNKLMARLATRHAKQSLGRDAQCALLLARQRRQDETSEVDSAEAERVLAELPARELPTIGWRAAQRLGIDSSQPRAYTVGELRRQWTLVQLQAALGKVAGQRVYNYARGADDDRAVTWMQPRKSVSAQIAWGVRFAGGEDAKVERFVADLARVVSERLRESGVQRCARLGVSALKRRAGAGAPYKPLGCGLCDESVRARDVMWVADEGVDDADAVLVRTAVALYWELGVPNEELRGVGVHAAKLDAGAGGSGSGEGDGRGARTARRDVGNARDEVANGYDDDDNDEATRGDRAAGGVRSGMHGIETYFSLVKRRQPGGREDAPRPASTEGKEAAHDAVAAPSAPPGVDEGVWHELPLEIRQQVRREMAERERHAMFLARCKRRRIDGGNGSGHVAAFQPTLLQFHHLRRGYVENTGAVLRVHDRERVSSESIYGVTRRRRRRGERDAEAGTGQETVERGRNGFERSARASVVELSMTDLSTALDAFFRRYCSDDDNYDGDDEAPSLLQRHFGAFIDDLVRRERWTYAYQFMQLLRRKIERVTRRDATAVSAEQALRDGCENGDEEEQQQPRRRRRRGGDGDGGCVAHGDAFRAFYNALVEQLQHAVYAPQQPPQEKEETEAQLIDERRRGAALAPCMPLKLRFLLL